MRTTCLLLIGLALTPTSLDAASGIGPIGAAACVFGPGTPYEEWQAWFYSGSLGPGGTPFANLGANGVNGTGTWSNGNVNVNLGSTSAGAVFVCFTSGPYNDATTPRVVVQEYIGNGNWIDLWSSSNLMTDVAYGIWFEGWTVRRIRLLVRENERNTGRRFLWAGSY